jgi:acyl-CoA thioester hydrolase
VARIGTKSLTFEYQVEEEAGATPLARAETVMVAYDYPTHASQPVSDAWRAKISHYENREF